MNNALIKGFGITALAAAVAACGGSGDSDSTGTVSMDVTDAPTASFTEVVVTFTGITLKPADGEAIEFSFDEAKTLNLLTLQGGESAPLLDGEEVLAGDYEWVRLTLDVDNSYVTEDDGSEKTLFIPSGAQTGLKLVSGFTVAQGGENNFTIDFDVRKSIVNPQGNGVADYFLKPALRLVDNLQVGSITGLVDYSNINSIRISDDAQENCAEGYEGSVYVYEGADAELSDLNVTNEEGNPLMVVPVELDDESGLYSYKAAFLTEGDYTVSYSCQVDDNEADDDIEFDGTQNVTVEANVETEAEDIPLVQ